MNTKLRSFLLWTFSFLLTASLAIYQRVTGPTYPTRGKVTIGTSEIKYKLLRTSEGTADALIRIIAPDTSIGGEITLRRFKSYDPWTTSPLLRSGDTLIAAIPGQPSAGKVMYQISLSGYGKQYQLSPEPVIIRFKGVVPVSVLWPHIIIIFLAMMLSTRAGLEALVRGKHTYLYTWLTVIFLLVGGMILGPVIQKFAFGAYWTGWPFGHDLTDNKSLVAFIFWIIALIVLIRDHKNRIWTIVASLVMLIVFLIPHSVLGSEIDHTKQPTESAK